MKEFKYVIKDEQGIHARPAGMFVKEAAAFSSKVTISKDGKEVDAKRILGVMGLGVKKDQEIVLRADGDDEDAAIEKLSAFLQEDTLDWRYYDCIGWKKCFWWNRNRKNRPF